MDVKRLLILLPCHSLEDFPTNYETEAAEGLLAAWTAPWHPTLVALAGAIPKWQRIDEPVAPLEGSLVVLPAPSAADAPPGLAQRLRDHQGHLVEPATSRGELVARLLAAALSPEAAAGDNSQLDSQLVNDFFALGYAYLQVQLLTRQMRYSSNLDQARFESIVVAAAREATQAPRTRESFDTARNTLGNAFDLLAQERDLYYSVDAYVLDITAIAATTLDDRLASQLGGSLPTSLLVLPEVWSKWDQLAPHVREAWLQAVEQRRACVLLGCQPEAQALLAPAEALRRWLLDGGSRLRAHFPQSGKVFAQRRFALTPFWPTLLRSLSVQGALHWALDDGRFPQGSQSKTRWRAADGSELESVTRTPCDAADSANFLTWSRRLGESMDMDHVAVLSVVHWPGGGCDAYHDLCRAATFGGALGKFVTAETFFSDTPSAPHSEGYSADRYRSPYLHQDVAAAQPDPLSSCVRYWRGYTAWKTSHGLALMQQAAGAAAIEPPACLIQWPQSAPAWDRQQLDQAEAHVRQSAAALAKHLVAASAGPSGHLLINPMSYPWRVGQAIQTTLSELRASPCVYAASPGNRGVQVVVDAPAGGYVWLGPGGEGRSLSPPRGPHLAHDRTLQNEFLQAVIHPQTGGLQALHDYQSRGNRLSQRLGIRHPGQPREPNSYAAMTAQQIRVVESSAVLGVIESQGSIVDQRGQRLAGFRQRFSLWRGSRVLLLDIELEFSEQELALAADPWTSYLAARFAWPDTGASMTRGLNGWRMSAEGNRLEAPQFLEIDDAGRRTAILTGGLPYHLKPSPSELDCLLVVRGETERRFRLGIGLDLPRTAALAEQLHAPPLAISCPAPASPEGWFLHGDARNTLVTSCEPVHDAQGASGIELRIQETEGRSARLKLQSWLPFREVRRTDLQGGTLGHCTLENGAAVVEMAAHEWCQFRALWRPESPSCDESP